MEIFEFILKQLPSLGTMGILLICSAFCSGSETALFSLTNYDHQKLNELSPKISKIIRFLLSKPERLLLVILSCNLTVNMFFFTISSFIVYHAVQAHHAILASAIGVLSLLTLILFGEIFPKAWAFNLRIKTAMIIAPPMWLIFRIIQPILTVLHMFVIVPLVRLFIGVGREPALSKQELQALLKISHREGYLQTAQMELLGKVINLRDLQVRQIMVPRVRMTACDIHIPIENARSLVRKTSQTRLPVFVFQIDQICGIVRARRLWTDNPRHLKDVLERVQFVPEYQRVDQLLHMFHTTKTDIAIVVDEYGGVCGMVSQEVVLEQVLDELSPEFSESTTPEILRIGPGQYMADGHLPVQDFFEYFKLPGIEASEVDTLAGLMMHLAGHFPEENEAIEYEHLRLKVHTYHHKSLKKIEITELKKTYVE
jgi:CBS domain containing-hemolysin-like protein